MAKRESQGMQIALILTVMFAVLFLITTVVFWNISRNAKAEAEQASAKATEAQETMRATISDNQTLKIMLGHAVDANMTTIEEQSTTDMSKFGASFPKEDRNYRKLPEFLSLALQQLHGKLAAANNRIAELDKTNQQLLAENQAQQAASQKAIDDAKTEYLTERTELGSELQQMKDVQATAQKKHEGDRREMVAASNQMQSSMRDVEKQLATMTTLNDKNSSELSQLKNESFETPDGKVIWVDYLGEMVQIDLGTADGLQRQIAFSVFDFDENNLARTDKKGSIEITQLLGEHLAEGRVINENLRNPIVAGDVIYSPTWQVGNPIRFALAGVMDIDNDGESDRELIRRLISINGGEIDAEVDDQGNRMGEITVKTRYLVVGDEIGEKSSGKLQRADAQMRTDAKLLGLTIITVDRLLSDLGYQRISKSIALGKQATEKDYQPSIYDPNPTGR